MRAIKVFAIGFFLCSLILFSAKGLTEKKDEDRLWIKADQDEVTVSVKDDRASWAEGITAGVGDDRSLTDRVVLTHIGKMDSEGRLSVTYTVMGDDRTTAMLTRKIRFSDYSAPTFVLLGEPMLERGTTLNLNELILVTDPLEGNITHKVQIIDSDVNMNAAGHYEMLLTVATDYGVSVDYTLELTVT